ncbi:MAG: hypothetical protein QXM31_03650 [Candidatus Woesearchaeota archaeon]
MTRGEFERELEQYISQRRRAKFRFPDVFGAFKGKKKMTEPELPPEVQKYDEGSPAEAPETMPGEEEAPEEPKKGVMTKILESLGLVGGGKKEEQIPAEQVKEMLAKDEHLQDMKEIAKIALLVTKKLPPEQLSEFKASPEFERLKELLRKHQLIK